MDLLARTPSSHFPARWSGILVFASAVALPGCGQELPGSASDHDSLSEPAGKSDGPAADVADAVCVIDTLFVDDVPEFSADLQASFDPSLVILPSHPYAFPELRVENGLRVSLSDYTDWSAFVYTFHGWDLVPGELVPEVIADSPLLFARIGDRQRSPEETIPDFDYKRALVADSLFAAMTIADEELVEFIASSEYEESFTRYRRLSPNGRILCDQVFYPDSGQPDRPVTTCYLSKVQWKRVQTYTPGQGAIDFCPSPQ